MDIEAEINRVSLQQQARRMKYEEEERLRREEFDRMEKEKLAFLARTRSVHAPMELYALWIGNYIKAGGRLTAYSDERYGDYVVYRMSGGFGANVEPLSATRIDEPRFWLPTAWPEGTRIPTGYGAASLDLFIMNAPSLAVNLEATRSEDKREGWEYGHTKALVLHAGGKATTNQPDHVVMYPDVAELLKMKSPEQIERAVVYKLKAVQAPLRLEKS